MTTKAKKALSRGAILKAAIDKSHVSIAAIARGVFVNRRTVYTWMEDDSAPLEKILQIGKIINYDFSQEIPEIKMLMDLLLPREGNLWQGKYYEQLEINNKLLKEKMDLLNQIEEKNAKPKRAK